MKNINELIFRVNNNLRNNLNVEKDDIKELLSIAMNMEKQFAIYGALPRIEQLVCKHCDSKKELHSETTGLCPDRLKHFEAK